jgi:hypothetical protein
MIGGLGRYGSEINVVLITQAILNNARVAAEAMTLGFNEARANKKAAVAAQAAADLAGDKFILKARNVLALYLGQQYSEDWAPTGFPNQSTATPDTMDERQTLLHALQNYFANHSVYENADLGVTAEQARLLNDTLVAARSAVDESYTQMAAAKNARDAAVRELRRRMRGCIEELSQLMEDNDPRWYAFGLNPPAAPETPEPVDAVELVATGAGHASASWETAPRADRFRVFKQIVGVDAEPVLVDTVRDTQFGFSGLTAGQKLRVQVQAGNDVGYAPPSETVEIMVT